jgi:hypothetical protein
MAGIVISGVSIAEPDRSPTPAVNTWSRLEGLPLSTDLEPALSAAVADPLWLLCRQWQFLEFAGEDAGSPIDVRVEGELARLSRYRPGQEAARDYSAEDLALEVAVEAEPVRDRHARLAAEAGVHLQWLLNNDVLVILFAGAYPVEPGPPGGTDADRFGAEWRAVAGVRGIDTRRLRQALAPLRDGDGVLTDLPPQPVVPPELRDRALAALRRWLTWYETAMVDPERAEAWDPTRQEYTFAVSAQTAAGELVLGAEEYTDGTLDWFSAGPVEGSLGPADPAQPAVTHTVPPVLPAPVDFAGKPADRFWEFEDATVHFGAIDAGPTDLTRILLVEFSLVYGNDWFVVPVRLPVGSLFRVTTCTVRDTFGVTSTVTRSQDRRGTRWSVFDLAGDFLYLPPTLAAPLGGPPIEKVQLARDEAANLAWGIEQTVPGLSGDGYDRAEEASSAASAELEPGPVDAALAYRLTSPVAEHWIPLVPVAAPGTTGGNPVVRLERRAVLRTEPDGSRHHVHPRGVLLRTDPRLDPDAEPPLRIEEEEVPREGAIVERAFQYARWFDGRSLLWLGRRKTAGRGEASSDLRFDTLHRPGG